MGDLFGGILGGGGGGGAPQSNPSADAAAQIAQQLFGQTQPIRNQLIGQIGTDLAAPDFTGLMNSPMQQAIKQATEQQFQVARQRTIANTPRGGALTGALANLEGARAGSLAQSQANAFNQENQLNRQQAFTAGFGTPGTSLSGLVGAGGIQANLANAEANRDAGKAGAAGQAIGSAAALIAMRS